jgi:hypothetical protein
MIFSPTMCFYSLRPLFAFIAALLRLFFLFNLNFHLSFLFLPFLSHFPPKCLLSKQLFSLDDTGQYSSPSPGGGGGAFFTINTPLGR